MGRYAVTETIVLPVVAMILNLIVIPMLLSQSVLAQESEFLAYENKDFGFSIQYPSDWREEGRRKYVKIF